MGGERPRLLIMACVFITAPMCKQQGEWAIELSIGRGG